MQSNDDTDDRNTAFWNELCGTHAAQVLGVTDASPQSIKRFDNWFLAYYPYVFLHIPFDELSGRDVLEVGLGYGTIAQRLAESGANYVGLDTAEGPVGMARHRFLQANLHAKAERGSILRAPFADSSFDLIVTIGCLHHTGDMRRALDECYRLLRPSGQLVVMLYYAYSYRRWVQARAATLKYWMRERLGYAGVVQPLREAETWDYDHNLAGETAPHTDFISVRSLKKLTSKFKGFQYSLENINVETPFQKWTSRRELLKTWYPRIVGLEIYATLTK